VRLARATRLASHAHRRGRERPGPYGRGQVGDRARHGPGHGDAQQQRDRRASTGRGAGGAGARGGHRAAFGCSAVGRQGRRECASAQRRSAIDRGSQIVRAQGRRGALCQTWHPPRAPVAGRRTRAGAPTRHRECGRDRRARRRMFGGCSRPRDRSCPHSCATGRPVGATGGRGAGAGLERPSYGSSAEHAQCAIPADLRDRRARRCARVGGVDRLRLSRGTRERIQRYPRHGGSRPPRRWARSG
jgi:hypothetical protein